MCLIRFDDICPTMDYSNFKKAVEIVEKFGIKPVIGVVPLNNDKDLIIEKEDNNFWEMVSKLEKKGWGVCMHGYTHVYNRDNPKTILCGRKHSEFAGNSLFEQSKMIEQGKDILERKGIHVDAFFAPAHTFDKNTLKALRKNGFMYNFDSFARRPYKRCGIVNLPCRPLSKNSPVKVFVIHTNEWAYKNEADQLSQFIEQNRDNFITFDEFKRIRRGNRIFQMIIEKIYVILYLLKVRLAKRLKRK